MTDLAPKSFRLDKQTRDQLARLATELDCSEAEVLRSSLAALDGLLQHRLDEWTFPGPDGKRVLHLPRAGGRTLMLAANDQGGYEPWQPFRRGGQWTEEAER